MTNKEMIKILNRSLSLLEDFSDNCEDYTPQYQKKLEKNIYDLDSLIESLKDYNKTI